jgi:hypothetical protein
MINVANKYDWCKMLDYWYTMVKYFYFLQLLKKNITSQASRQAATQIVVQKFF